MFLTMVAASLAGCTATMPTVPGDKQSVNFNAALLQDCKDLPKTKSSSDEDLKDWATIVIDSYIDCATNKKKENAEIKKALNIK
jgi:hypothetical protein